MASSRIVRVPRLGKQVMRSVVDGAIATAVNKLGYKATSHQEKAIRELVLGKDVFVSLPTGSGKSLCYAALPYVFNTLRARDDSIVVVVCPLQAIMEDQVSKYTCKGLKAAFVGKSQKDDDIREGVDSCSSLEKQFRQEYEGSLSKIFSASAGTWTTKIYGRCGCPEYWGVLSFVLLNETKDLRHRLRSCKQTAEHRTPCLQANASDWSGHYLATLELVSACVRHLSSGRKSPRKVFYFGQTHFSR